MRITLIQLLSPLPVLVLTEPLSESDFNKQFCDSVGGQTETRHFYIYAGGRSHIRVDCETATTVYECGLDKRSSLDSVQQALFASHLTGKRPGVVIYDTDEREGRIEYRIRVAAQAAGVRYTTYNLKPQQ